MEEKPLKNFSSHSWALPSHIIVFLKNAIVNIKSRKIQLSPWPEFKKSIFLAYDHRVENAPEINGLINNSYLTLDEHLMIFLTSSPTVS